MKVLTSTCERAFLSSIFRNKSHSRRLDGRESRDGRTVEIAFGKERGCCIVMQGNTRIIAQVSCEISQPKSSRPTEGSLLVNFELSPMAAPHFESGRISDEGIESSRLLERCIRDSRCIDLESLCIVAGEKVWNIRVDVQALNHDGNLIECSSIAAISALAHFRRPDVTVIGTDVTVHSPDDHNPIALSLHHMPVNVNMAIYEKGEYILMDPVEIEERVAEGRVVIGVNAHQEICLLHLSGGLVLTKDKLLHCTDLAVKRAQVITQTIRNSIEVDSYKRAANEPVGFVTMLHTGTLLGAKKRIPRFDVNDVNEDPQSQDSVEEIEDSDKEESSPIENGSFNLKSSATVHKIQTFLEHCGEAAAFEGGSSKWEIEATDESSSESERDEDAEEESPMKEEKEVPCETGSDDDDDEEEEGAVLQSDQVDAKVEATKNTRGWYTKNAFM